MKNAPVSARRARFQAAPAALVTPAKDELQTLFLAEVRIDLFLMGQVG